MDTLEKNIDSQIFNILVETVNILFPFSTDQVKIIKRHCWRNKKYLGEKDGKVVAWQGWSVNLAELDFRYRAVFINVVNNILAFDEKLQLFGKDFVNATTNLDKFIVLYVLDFPQNSIDEILKQGFIPRKIGRVLHACIIISFQEFLDYPSKYWAAQLTKLVMVQRFLSIHRKPIDTNEVPLQHLIYKTGYLHSYIINQGLELHALSKPRKAGEFGHDFHAIVSNPKNNFWKFPIGFEVYTGAMGYHINTIPSYIYKFNLRGLIIISKDDPFPSLIGDNSLSELIVPVKNLSEFEAKKIGIHYLPLEKVVLDLMQSRDQLESLIPTVLSHAVH